MTRARLGRVVGAIGASARPATSMAVLAPAAEADPRCSTHSHTHGAAWWQWTDDRPGRSASRSCPGKTEYRHTSADPKSCG